jgi:hypothetical protein
MKIPFTVAVWFMLGAGVCFAQGGIYSIVDPAGSSLNGSGESTLGMVVGDSIDDIEIVEYNGGWEDEYQAKKELMAKLQDKEIVTSSGPLWNMDTPVQLVGVIRYHNGAQGKVAVAQHRVAFQDQAGKAWYFQWDERIPW